MSKFVIAVFIIGFWLVFPVPFMFMGMSGFETDTIIEVSQTDSPTALNYISVVGNSMRPYFRLLTIGIDGAPYLLNRFMNLMQLISLLFIIVLIRGS